MPDAGRLNDAFLRVRSRAEAALPWLSRARLHIGCPMSEKEHRKKWRQFAHACHHRMGICIAKDAEHELTDRELAGVFAHEFGHIVGDELEFPAHKRSRRSRSGKTPASVQREADEISRRFFGIRVKKNRRSIQEAV